MDRPRDLATARAVMSETLTGKVALFTILITLSACEETQANVSNNCTFQYIAKGGGYAMRVYRCETAESICFVSLEHNKGGLSCHLKP